MHSMFISLSQNILGITQHSSLHLQRKLTLQHREVLDTRSLDVLIHSESALLIRTLKDSALANLVHHTTSTTGLGGVVLLT